MRARIPGVPYQGKRVSPAFAGACTAVRGHPGHAGPAPRLGRRAGRRGSGRDARSWYILVRSVVYDGAESAERSRHRPPAHSGRMARPAVQVPCEHRRERANVPAGVADRMVWMIRRARRPGRRRRRTPSGPRSRPRCSCRQAGPGRGGRRGEQRSHLSTYLPGKRPHCGACRHGNPGWFHDQERRRRQPPCRPLSVRLNPQNVRRPGLPSVRGRKRS
jgi:hypothetical protein